MSSGLGLGLVTSGLGLVTSGLGLGLVTSGLVNIPAEVCYEDWNLILLLSN